MTALADHLWQSLLFIALVRLLVSLTRRHSARVRLWLWRGAALKFLAPFALVAAAGGLHPFPVQFHGDPPPAHWVALVERISPWFSLDGWFQSTSARVALLTALLLASLGAVRATLGGIHTEAWRARIEALRLERDPDDREASVGFARAALMTFCALVVMAIPLLGGSIRAGVHAHGLLMANTRALADAPVTLRPARPGLGSRYILSVDADGVRVRNITLRELAGLAYGVSRFMVRGRHFQERDGNDWMVDSRYDVRITGRIVEPETFDTYALRRPITRELSRNLGLEIYVNSQCQAPCGKWGDRVLVEVEPGRWALVERPAAP